MRGAVELSPSRAAGKVVDRDNVGTFGLGHARVRFTVGEDELEATGGEIVVVPAGAAHGFTNVGAAPMRSINVHPVARMQTEWLD